VGLLIDFFVSFFGFAALIWIQVGRGEGDSFAECIGSQECDTRIFVEVEIVPTGTSADGVIPTALKFQSEFPWEMQFTALRLSHRLEWKRLRGALHPMVR